MDSLILNNMTPDTLKGLPEESLFQLCGLIRERIIDTVSKTGGHLASNLGVVELTVALHRVFDCPVDKLIFDVGHQSYVHKILTGRGERLGSLRSLGGLSGFPRQDESECDAFGAGHSSTSVSAALGMARARQLTGGDYHVIAVIGDGALTGGMAYEALNDAGRSKIPLIVVLNDNDMSIAQNVGAMQIRLTKLRAGKGYLDFKQSMTNNHPRLKKWMAKRRDTLKRMLLSSNLFEELGFKYLGPIDGHDLKGLVDIFERAKRFDRPVLIHVVTQKGRGFEKAELDPEKYHGIAPFFVDGAENKAVKNKRQSNSAVMAKTLVNLAKADKSIVAVTAAMPSGTGLSLFRDQYPERFFDVGIAEQHAVTMCAGMAACGLRPVLAVYSSFMQRAYDQIMHDVCAQKLPVVICVDRSGLVGEDGQTHHGAYDIGILSQMPGLTVLSPSTQNMLADMLGCAMGWDGPTAIRYPRTPLPEGENTGDNPLKWRIIRPVKAVTVVSTGVMLSIAQEASEGLDIGLIDACCIKPMDNEALKKLERCKTIIVPEDGVAQGGLGSLLALRLTGVRIKSVALPDKTPPAATVEQQLSMAGLDRDSIRKIIKEQLTNER